MQIVKWDVKDPVITKDGEIHYNNRLTTILTDSKFTLKITNAQYNDTGNYSMRVITENPFRKADDTATVHVYGMYSCYFKD